jgi:DNA-entry nuclease
MMRITKKLYALLIAGMMVLSLAGCQSTGNSSSDNTQSEQTSKGSSSTKSVSSENIPDFSGNMTVVVDNNNPDFTSKDLTTKSYESYSKLDSEGRCQVAEACVGKDIMPKGKRGDIGMVKPTGWHTVKYDNVDGKYLYNRCHLIAYQLTGENANNKNLITGTRSFNVDGMLSYEEMVGDYVRETGNHVLYRVTPVFDGDDLVAKGVQMEAMSVEDKGEDIKFNVFVYNVQDGVKIDYETGESKADSSVEVTTENSEASKKYHTNQSSSNNSNSSNSNNSNSKSYSSNNKSTTVAKTNTKTSTSKQIRGNSRSKVYHCPGQRDYDRMGTSKYLVTFKSEKEAQKAGYHKAKR